MIEQYVDMNTKLYRISCVNISFNTCTLDWRSAFDSCLICSLPRFVAKVSCSLSVVGIIHVPATRRMAADWTSLRSAAVVSTAPRAICAYNGLAWELPQIHSHMPPPQLKTCPKRNYVGYLWMTSLWRSAHSCYQASRHGRGRHEMLGGWHRHLDAPRSMHIYITGTCSRSVTVKDLCPKLCLEIYWTFGGLVS